MSFYPPENELKKLVESYELVLNPTVSYDVRKNAEQYCEAVKNSGVGGLTLGLTLLDARNRHAIHLRNLGLNILDHSVRTAAVFDTLSPTDQINFRNSFWQLVIETEGGLEGIEREKRLIREKVASIMAILGCRFWLRDETDPAAWNDFFERFLMGTLHGTMSPSSTLKETLRKQELVLLCIASLIEIIRIGTVKQAEVNSLALPLTDQRRQQLHDGLELVLPSFVDWIFTNFPPAVQQVSIPSETNPQVKECLLSVLSAAISCFNAVSQWMSNMKPEGMIPFLSSCFSILEYLSNNDNHDPTTTEQLVTNTLEGLLALVQYRSFPVVEQDTVEYLLANDGEVPFGSGGFPRLVKLAEIYAGQDEDSYLHLKLISEILLNLGTRQICNKKNAILPKNPISFLSVMMGILQIPSLTISSAICEFWSAALRAEALFNHPMKPLDQIIPNLYIVILNKYASNPVEERRRPYNKIDFDEIEEFKEVSRVQTGRLGDLIRLMAVRWSPIVLEYSYNALGSFIQSNLDKIVVEEPASEIKKQWETLVTIVEHVLRGIPSLSDDNTNLPMLVKLLQLLTVHMPLAKCPEILGRWIYGVRALCSNLSDFCPQDDFGRVIQLFFDLLLNFKGREEEMIRGRSCAAMLRLADITPKSFFPFIAPLLQVITPILERKNVARERKLFSELILILVNEIADDPERQMLLFETVAGPIIRLLEGARGILMTEGADGLMNALGFGLLNGKSSLEEIIALSAEDENIKRCKGARTDLNVLISTLHILFKRLAPLVAKNPNSTVSKAFCSFMNELISFVMVLTQKLHLIGTWPAWQRFYNLPAGQRPQENHFYMMIYGDVFDEDEGGEEGVEEEQTASLGESTLTAKTICGHLKGWLKYSRLMTYMILGMASQFGESFYSLPQLTDRLLGLVFSSLEGLTLQDWNHLVKSTINPLLLNCPVSALDDLLRRILQGVLGYLGPFLTQEWQVLIINPPTSSTAAKAAAIAKEISRESALLTVTASMITLIYDLMCPAEEREKMKTEPSLDLKFAMAAANGNLDRLLPRIHLTDNNRTTWILYQSPDELILQLLQFLVNTLKWPRPSIGFGRIVQILSRIVPGCLAGGRSFAVVEFILVNLSTAVIDVLLVPGKPRESWIDLQGPLIYLLTELYKWAHLITVQVTCTSNNLNLTNLTPDMLISEQFLNPIDMILQSHYPSMNVSTLRKPVLIESHVKSQRSLVKNFINKCWQSKLGGSANSSIDSAAMQRVSERLGLLKRTLQRAKVNDENRNDGGADGIDGLGDLFNE